LERNCTHYSYFVQKRDATRYLKLSLHHKIIAILCMLCYGLCVDVTDIILKHTIKP
jgi:hypothetical protein